MNIKLIVILLSFVLLILSLLVFSKLDVDLSYKGVAFKLKGEKQINKIFDEDYNHTITQTLGDQSPIINGSANVNYYQSK